MEILIKFDKIIFITDFGEKEFPKSLGANWSKLEEYWEMPLTLMNCCRVSAEMKEKTPKCIQEFMDNFFRQGLPAKLPKLKIPLMKHQSEGVLRIINNKRYGIFHDMGLGKTAEIIALASWIYENKKKCRILVICPLSVISTWEKQIEKFCAYPYEIIRLTGTTGERRKALEELNEKKPKGIQFSLLNYDGARLIHDEILDIDWTCLCADEVSRIKNKDAKCTKIATELADKTKYVVALTGTPISNTIEDIFSIGRFINPLIFGENFWKFGSRFIVWGGFEMHQAVGVKNKEELYWIINQFSHTVKKNEVLDLPEITYDIREIELYNEQANIYKKAEEEFRFCCQAVEKGDTNAKEHQVLIRNALSRLTRCQQITAGHTKNSSGEVIYLTDNEKLREAMEIIQDSRPQKIVIFSRFVEDLNILYDEINKINLQVRIFSGETILSDREQILKDFDEEKIDVLLVQINTGGFGVDLSKASIVIFYSNWFSYNIFSQALSRVHRFGQKNNVLCVHLLCKDTIDEDIYKIIEKKTTLSNYFFGKELEKKIEMEGEELDLFGK